MNPSKRIAQIINETGWKGGEDFLPLTMPIDGMKVKADVTKWVGSILIYLDEQHEKSKNPVAEGNTKSQEVEG